MAGVAIRTCEKYRDNVYIKFTRAINPEEYHSAVYGVPYETGHPLDRHALVVGIASGSAFVISARSGH